MFTRIIFYYIYKSKKPASSMYTYSTSRNAKKKTQLPMKVDLLNIKLIII